MWDWWIYLTVVVLMPTNRNESLGKIFNGEDPSYLFIALSSDL